jgi:hypothetical protein
VVAPNVVAPNVVSRNVISRKVADFSGIEVALLNSCTAGGAGR